jgi:hypothetical protein
MLQTCRLTLVLALFASAASLSTGVSAAATQLHFKSPSGNINCYLFASQGGVADCNVHTSSWSGAPGKPASCTLDWAQDEVQLVRSHVTVGSCRGDVGPLCYAGGDRCSVLAYGHGVTVGGIRCSSSASGMTCRRTSGSRPGFRIAREGVTVYR